MEQSATNRREARLGVACGLGAYLWWGFVPLYFKLVTHVAPIQVLAHRVIWSFVFVILLIGMTGAWMSAILILRQPRTMLMLLLSTLVLSVNWYVFIYAVEQNKVMLASLGYFINPLVNVLLGVVFLHERLRKIQLIGLMLAVAGVACMTWGRGQLPAIALLLAGSFGLYGLFRKIAPVGAVVGLAIETALLVVPGALLILFGGPQLSTYDASTLTLLALAGVVTAVPLLMFTAAARRLRLSTMGFLQYLGPTCQFLLAVFAFREPLEAADMISFALIWSALAVYSWDSYSIYRRGVAPMPSVPAEP